MEILVRFQKKKSERGTSSNRDKSLHLIIGALMSRLEKNAARSQQRLRAPSISVYVDSVFVLQHDYSRPMLLVWQGEEADTFVSTFVGTYNAQVTGDLWEQYVKYLDEGKEER